MGKREILECDLTKQELGKDEEFVRITIKAPGKRTGRSYDLSPTAAAKLEEQLTATSDRQLDPETMFSPRAVRTANPDETAPATDGRGSRRRQAQEAAGFVPEEESSEEDEEDDRAAERRADAEFVAKRKRELREAGRIPEAGAEPTEEELEDKAEQLIAKASMGGDGTKCTHMNKSRVHMTIRNNERYAYRICKDCRKRIPVHKADNNEAYLAAKAPKGSREGYHNQH